jgi:hypothetical protein
MLIIKSININYIQNKKNMLKKIEEIEKNGKIIY